MRLVCSNIHLIIILLVLYNLEESEVEEEEGGRGGSLVPRPISSFLYKKEPGYEGRREKEEGTVSQSFSWFVFAGVLGQRSVL